MNRPDKALCESMQEDHLMQQQLRLLFLSLSDSDCCNTC